MAHSKNLVFLSGKRTPFGKNGGSLLDQNPSDLGLCASKAAMEQANVTPSDIDHVIFGNVLHSARDSIYTPRHIGLKAGIPHGVPSLGINRLCGSGFQVIVEAFHQMLAGDTKIALVGGVENMSMTPYSIWGARWGLRMGHSQIEDVMTTALTDSYPNMPMAMTAELLGEKYKVTRDEADEFACRSQNLTEAARKEGRFRDELATYSFTDRKKREVKVENDEHPRDGMTKESLAKLPSLFKKDGLVTAGNASGIVDGAAAMVVAEEQEVTKRDLKPLARLVSYGISGCDPKIMGIGPAPASRIALEKAGLKLDDMDVIEVNEAFAAQTVAVEKELGIPREKLNVNGGAIAIGHPLAGSGTRIIATLIYELRRRKKRYGMGAACIGGGQGISLIVEAL